MIAFQFKGVSQFLQTLFVVVDTFLFEQKHFLLWTHTKFRIGSCPLDKSEVLGVNLQLQFLQHIKFSNMTAIEGGDDLIISQIVNFHLWSSERLKGKGQLDLHIPSLDIVLTKRNAQNSITTFLLST